MQITFRDVPLAPAGREVQQEGDRYEGVFEVMGLVVGNVDDVPPNLQKCQFAFEISLKDLINSGAMLEKGVRQEAGAGGLHWSLIGGMMYGRTCSHCAQKITTLLSQSGECNHRVARFIWSVPIKE
jgi:hypothetical protein